MIVAPQPEAVEAGIDTLRDGGNAIDAVIACALAQGVVDPMMCGLGGFGVLHVFDAATGMHLIFDGLSTTPRAAREGLWADEFERECPDGFGFVVRDNVNELGRAAVTTPGLLRVLSQAHVQLGRLPWEALVPPAVSVAMSGWTVRPHVAATFRFDDSSNGRPPYPKKLALTADGARLYLRPDGTPKQVGDLVVNPDLADTLRVVAREGADTLYTGELARRVVDDMQRHGGLLTAEDLAGFQPESREPLRVSYRGYDVALPPPPAGGVMVAEMLRILDRFDMTALGHNSAEYIQVASEAMKFAARDKDRHIGDPRFVPPPLDRLLSDAYADECAASIRAGEKVALPRFHGGVTGTTTVSCVDADGMVVSLTHTLGTSSGVIVPGTGFMLNGGMNAFDPRPGRAGSIAPGKRRFSTMSPTIVLADGQPVATLGAPGGAWIPVALTQVLVNLLDWGMGVSEAICSPRFSATNDTLDISNRISVQAQMGLEDAGYQVRRSPFGYPFAGVHGITMFGGLLEGAADPQRDGYAAGV